MCRNILRRIVLNLYAIRLAVISSLSSLVSFLAIILFISLVNGIGNHTYSFCSSRRMSAARQWLSQPDSIQLFVEPSDSLGPSSIISKLGRIKDGLLFQDLDLQINQLKDFSLDCGGFIRLIRDHMSSPPGRSAGSAWQNRYHGPSDELLTTNLDDNLAHRTGWRVLAREAGNLGKTFCCGVPDCCGAGCTDTKLGRDVRIEAACAPRQPGASPCASGLKALPD